MKKLALLTLSLCMCAVMLVGCGCMNTNADVTTLPTNGELTRPSTAPSTVPTTAATTTPTSAPTEDTATTGETGAVMDTTGPVEGAVDDILGSSTADTSGANGTGRSRGMMPRK